LPTPKLSEKENAEDSSNTNSAASGFSFNLLVGRLEPADVSTEEDCKDENVDVSEESVDGAASPAAAIATTACEVKG